MLDTTQTTNFASLVYEIGSVLEKEMGGSSGSLLSIMFTAMAAEMRNSKVKEDKTVSILVLGNKPLNNEQSFESGHRRNDACW